MRTSRQLDALMPRTRQAILSTLLINPERRWYLRELARETHLPPSSLQQELKSLSEAGILSRFNDVGRTVYQANPELPYILELQSIFKRTVAIDTVLRAALEPYQYEIEIAFIYGSFASSKEVSSSDVDLLIVSDKQLLDLHVGLREAEQTLHREINVVQYSPGDLRDAWSAQRNFVRTIVSSPKIFLIGDTHVLTATLGDTPHQDAPDHSAGNQRFA